jgi:guanylate kinase
MTNSNSHFFVVSGASGSGKTSICRKVSDILDLYYSVSHTSRPMRAGERDGYDYHFVPKDTFLQLIESGEFLEWAAVYGNHYGTSKRLIDEKLAEGKSVILDVETQGAANIKKLYPDAVTIFLKTLSTDDLRQRLLARGRDSEEEIERRVGYASNEIAKINQYDHVVTNDDFNEAVESVLKIVSTKLKI